MELFALPRRPSSLARFSRSASSRPKISETRFGSVPNGKIPSTSFLPSPHPVVCEHAEGSKTTERSRGWAGLFAREFHARESAEQPGLGDHGSAQHLERGAIPRQSSLRGAGAGGAVERGGRSKCEGVASERLDESMMHKNQRTNEHCCVFFLLIVFLHHLCNYTKYISHVLFKKAFANHHHP